MRAVWSVADCIVSPLGNTSEENYEQLVQGKPAVRTLQHSSWSDQPVCVAAMEKATSEGCTHFETVSIRALKNLLNGFTLPTDRTLFILSTTKGNNELVDRGQPIPGRIHLHETAAFLAETIGLTHYTTVSNACISGVLALIVAKRYLQSGRFDHAVVLGADVLSRFIVSGFQSLQALSAGPCRPFDKSRSGINLGEAAAAMLLTATPESLPFKKRVLLKGEGVSNDANHISGPSRTGAELAWAIEQAMATAGVSADQLGLVSAHGTATIYNDEMEAKAFARAGLQHVPVNSLKGYYGHTLGAAGLVEAIITSHSMLANQVLPSYGFVEQGVSETLNICTTLQEMKLKYALKTASGFGGCNAALVLENVHHTGKPFNTGDTLNTEENTK